MKYFDKKILSLMLLIGIVQIALYYLFAATVRGDGGFPIPHKDTLLYCQAARRIVEGAPFSFSEGSAASSGTTGILYPFILAVPYALGYTGDSLFLAGFCLNAIFYLLFICGWGIVVVSKIKSSFPRQIAAVLVATFGQAAYSAFAQNDMGLLLAWSSFFAAGLALGSRWLYGSLLILFPWVRPEGDVCVIAFLMVLAFRFFHRKDSIRELVLDSFIAFFAVVSAVGVFAMNWKLTGMAGFSSLAYKGHFSTTNVFAAVFRTATDLMKMAKSLFLGLPDSAPRDFYFIPVIGAVAVWAGILLRAWRKDSCWREWVWFFSLGGGLLTVAQSGWQNTNVDRYVGWFLPTLLLFAAGGIGLIARFDRLRVPAQILAVLMMLFGVAIAPIYAFMFRLISRDADVLREFAVTCEKALPAGASVGTWGGDVGFAYEMSPRKVCHLCGIYSMEYLCDNMCGCLEILKNEPETRFDFWFWSANQSEEFGVDPTIIGDQILVGPVGSSLLRAKWQSFDVAATLPDIPETQGKALVSRVDVGYDHDEKATRYQVEMRYNVDTFVPFVIQDDFCGKKATDVVRLIVGMDSMDVDLKPGQDVVVVMRTYPERSINVPCGGRNVAVKYAFSNPLELNIAVDGELVSKASVSYSEKGFSDVAFTIPGSAIKTDRPRVSFLGDHIVGSYWFYQ